MAVDEGKILKENFQYFWKVMEHIYKHLSSQAMELRRLSIERKKLETLLEITGGEGGMMPFIQEWNSQNTAIAREVIRRAQLDKDLKFLPVESEGYTILYTNEEGHNKLKEIREQIIRELGQYHAEVRPSELAKAILADAEHDGGTTSMLSIEIPMAQYQMMADKGLLLGSDFSMGYEDLKNGMVKVSVRASDMFGYDKEDTWLNRNDLFTELVRSAIALNMGGASLSKELIYDKNLKDRLLEFDGPGSTYVTSQINGGGYIELNKDGYQAYRIVSEGFNARRIKDGPEVKKSDFKDPVDYKKELYKTLLAIEKPVEINNDIYKKHEAVLKNMIGTGNTPGLEFSSKNLMRKTIKAMMKDMDIPLPNSIGENRKYFETAAIERVLNKAYDTLTTGEIAEFKNDKAFLNELKKEFYLGGELKFLDKDLYKELMAAMEKTTIRKELDVDRAMEDPDYLAEQAYKAIDAVKEVDPEVWEKVNSLEKDYEKGLTDLCEGLSKEVTPNNPEKWKEIEKAFDRAQKATPNHAFDVVLGHCLTGEVIKDVRPIELEIKDIAKRDLVDSLAEEVAAYVEKSISDRGVDLSAISSQKDITEALTQAKKEFKALSVDLKGAEKDEIKDLFYDEKYGPNLGALYKKLEMNGMEVNEVVKSWYEISDCSVDMVKESEKSLEITDINKDVIKDLSYQEAGKIEYKLLDARNDLERNNSSRVYSMSRDDISFGQTLGEKPKRLTNERRLEDKRVERTNDSPKLEDKSNKKPLGSHKKKEKEKEFGEDD